jgi:fatty acid desaturase
MRDPSGVAPTLGAVSYAALGHMGGVALLLRAPESAGLAALGVLCCAHARIVASYLVHEAAHSSVFKRPKANAAFGTLCLWLCVPARALAAAAARVGTACGAIAARRTARQRACCQLGLSE